MNPSEAIQTFTEHHPFVGPALWIASVQYYVLQIVAALAWHTPAYSWQLNAISDLGNTACGLYADRYVCSPLHGLMNLSFMVLGITMIVGATLIYRGFEKTPGTAIGFTFMGIAGVGTILVGIFPENSIGLLHSLGALLPFLIGNLGMVVLGAVLDIPRWLRWYSLASGIVSLLALIFLTSGQFLGLGFGGMERMVVYPQTMWLIVFGIYVSSDRIRHPSKKLP